MRWVRHLLGATLAIGSSSLLPPSNAEGGPRSAASCVVCHSAAIDGLRATVHASLLEQSSSLDAVCVACHGEQRDHVESTRRAERAFVAARPVLASACATCHGDADLAVAAAVHPWSKRLGGELVPETSEPVIEAVPSWTSSFELGQRFVSVHGSEDRFRTDFDLDDGFRLRGFELRGSDLGLAQLDGLELEATDIADPYQRVDLRLRGKTAYEAGGEFSETRYSYRGGGDFNRVDQRRRRFGFDLQFPVATGLDLMLGYAQERAEGFWLTRRIGNQNLTPQTFVDGVQSPRDAQRESLDLGVAGSTGATRWSAALEYRDDEATDRWRFDRAAQADPSLRESLDFRSRSTLRGPGARWSLGRELGPWTLDATGRFTDFDRRVTGTGTASGVDVGPFITTSRSDSRGDARTWLIDLTATLELRRDLRFIADVRWRDHIEELRIDQVDTTVFPTLSTTTIAAFAATQRTSQRKLDGVLELEFDVHDALTLGGGYTFAREALRVPDLLVGDADFASGTIHDQGFVVGFDWRPSRGWAVIGRYEERGQGSVQLHELAEDDARIAEGRVRFRGGVANGELFVKHRRNRNGRSLHRSETTAFGGTASIQLRDELGGFVSFSDTESDVRTLTNFYFDPDPDPVPTVVGFDGRTRSLAFGFDGRPSADLRWRGDVAWTDTRGSFDVELLEWRLEAGVATNARGSVGAEYHRVEYAEAGGAADFRSDALFVFWRQRFGSAR